MRHLPLLALLVACATTPDVEPTATCNSCHGSEATNAWPPNALGGFTDIADRGVGAHGAHQFPSVTGPGPVACSECHINPTAVDDEGHIDDAWPADMTWGPLAQSDGADTTWNTDTLTCSGSYCHGATMAAPGTHSEPVWTDPPGTQSSCSSCHQFPPPAPHPPGGTCGECHAPTAVGAGLAEDKSTHIDGIVQLDGVTPGSCAAGCHGDDEQTNPPLDLTGNTDTTAPGVGAHEVHLDASLGVSVSCSTCHPVPASVNEGSHLDGTTDIVFGGIANNGNTTSTWDPVGLTCTTYCHGASLPGGGQTAPVWNVVDGSQTSCASCHGNPPPPPHPANPSCGNCHGGGGTDPAEHIDGGVDF